MSNKRCVNARCGVLLDPGDQRFLCVSCRFIGTRMFGLGSFVAAIIVAILKVIGWL